jgi:hypothetical protein
LAALLLSKEVIMPEFCEARRWKHVVRIPLHGRGAGSAGWDCSLLIAIRSFFTPNSCAFYKKTIAALSFLMLLTGCISFSRTEREPVPENDPVETVTLKLDANYAGEDGLLPRLVYVFPPLEVGQDGQPLNDYFYTESEKGLLNWYASAPESGLLRDAVMDQFRYRGFTPVSFYELTESTDDHSVLVITLYYTNPLTEIKKQARFGGRVKEYMLFTRLSGATFPKDLSPAGKKEVLNQEALSRCSDQELIFPVIEQAFRYSVKHVGKNSQFVNIVPVTDQGFMEIRADQEIEWQPKG